MKINDERLEDFAYGESLARFDDAALMAKELLAARKVIEAAKALLNGHQNCGTTDCCLVSQEIDAALAVYDKL